MKIESVSIVGLQKWGELVSGIRGISLIGDDKLKPYRNARIQSKLVTYRDVAPLSLYALKSNLEFQRHLRDRFLKLFEIDTLDQDHTTPHITFQIGGESGIWNISPPIVEVSPHDGNRPVLVDGEHRFLLSRDLGKPIRVIWIDRIPKKYPTVALPVKWTDIVIYQETPPTSKKRIYRYQSVSEFPDIGKYSDVKITSDNFRYFFYRDFNPLSTTFIRKS